MRVRGAGPRDIPYIEKLLDEYGFHVNPKHLELLIVAEDEKTGEVFGVASLNTLLEATFITDKSKPIKKRLEALDLCTKVGEKTVKQLGYEYYHSFATNPNIKRIMTKRYSYEKADGEVLIKWVD